MPLIEPLDLLWCSFLLNTDDGEDKLNNQIVDEIQDYDKSTKDNPDHVEFRCFVNEDQYEEIMIYNEILQFVEKDSEIIWKFKRISAHEGTIYRTHP